ncbi:UNVERIFIED_CONTAM: Retrovirus-related Pol polyprotein from transposon gypsy [Sesamum calycinum]|uniref:Retrovirus-related Pol polyprotein from transposon gypsy n=1 Tax=Sesamum calycinum TaxID=2727403 RepID=A0AAW2PAC7_9LAMI
MTDMGLEIKDAPEEPFEKIGERRVEAVEELKVINLSEDDEKTTKIGTTMRPSTEEHLIQFLKKNKEVFAWTMTDLHGISPDVITHKLSVNPSAKPPNGKWRLCIDFTDLNKACPKDPFPLPRIDILVDSTSGCEMLSFLDAYQGYNQIPLAPEDQEKASFVTDQGVFCYNVMPFGLKNAGATYQRLVNHMFQNQIGRNMEVYIDDMLVKSEKEQDHIKDLEAIKAQVLADFVVELAYDEASISTPTWSVYVDGSSTSTGSGAGVALESPQGDKFEYAIKLDFPSSNNEAEYEAFLAGCELALAAGAKRIVIYSDSQLVVNQVQGSYEARDEKMAKYFSKAKNMLGKFEEASVVQVSRANNATADQLAKLASSMAAIRSRKIIFISSERAAIEEPEEVICIDPTL